MGCEAKNRFRLVPFAHYLSAVGGQPHYMVASGYDVTPNVRA